MFVLLRGVALRDRDPAEDEVGRAARDRVGLGEFEARRPGARGADEDAEAPVFGGLDVVDPVREGALGAGADAAVDDLRE